MSQKNIKVMLMQDEGIDILRFFLDEEKSYDMNLNSDTCQSEIKNVFYELLRLSVEEDIKLTFEAEEGYPKELYKDVCLEYITAIQREIEISTDKIRTELSND